MGERTPHTHDTNMEGRQRTWREGKERTRERKGKEICQDFLVFSQAGLYMYVYVYLYLKSRNHDLLKELKELDGNHSIIEGASLMSR